MSSLDAPRPAKFYQYAERTVLERALTLGEFRLQPPPPAFTSEQILPFKSAAPRPSPQYLTITLSTALSPNLIDPASGFDCCLVIHDSEAFGERIHRAAQRALPNWAGIDAAVSYGVPSPLGEVFSRSRQEAGRKEWLFAWRPIQVGQAISPIVIQIGSLAGIAELREQTS